MIERCVICGKPVQYGGDTYCHRCGMRSELDDRNERLYLNKEKRRCRCGHTLREHQRTLGGKLVVEGCRICIDAGCVGFIEQLPATAPKEEPDAKE